MASNHLALKDLDYAEVYIETAKEVCRSFKLTVIPKFPFFIAFIKGF